MNRRDLIRTLGLASISATLPWRSAAGTHVRPALDALGVQLYTLREEMARDFVGTLIGVSEIGYRKVEFAGYFDRDPELVRYTLEVAGLRSPATHVSTEALGDDLARTIDTALTVGHEMIVLPWLPENMRRTLDDWRRTAEFANTVGQRCRAAGLQFAYHNHAFEFTPIDDQIPFDLFLSETDEDLVKIELDLFWLAEGGGNPLTLFRRWPGRFPAVHLKDRSLEGRMVDVGAGEINWPAILSQRELAGIRHLFVEHDDPTDPYATVRAGYEYLNNLNV